MSDENTLWMGDIQPWMNESLIINSFQQFNIYPINVKLIKDKKKNINRNYCFVTFKNIQDANNALNNLNGNKLPNANINFKLNKAEYQNSKTVYVGNLNSKVGDNDLLKLFSQKYKSVYHANVISGKGASKAYGFVIFKNEDDYARCLKEMSGFNFYGNIIKVREKRKKDDENNTINNNIIGKKNKDKNKNHMNEINEDKINNYLLNNKNNNDNNLPFIYQNNSNVNNNNNNNIYNNNINKIINNTFYNANSKNSLLNEINNINIVNNTPTNKNNIINFNAIQNINIFNNGINNYNNKQSIEYLLNKYINNSSASFINLNNNSLIADKNKINSKNIHLQKKKDNNVSFQIDNNDKKLNLNININNMNFINNNNKNTNIKKDKIMNKKSNKINEMNVNNNINNINNNSNSNNKIDIKNKNNIYKDNNLEVLNDIDDITLTRKIHESILRTFEYHKKMFNNNGIKFKSK